MGTLKQVSASHQCPLCESKKIRVEDSLSGEQLLTLWRELGFHLATEDLIPVTHSGHVQLWHCQSCKFAFFDQDLTGTDRFYYQLSLSPAYYANHRPEFAHCSNLAMGPILAVRTVLDVGCGYGGFLDEARAAGLQTHGIELNKDAREKAARRGHKVEDSFLQDLDPSLQYDPVTAKHSAGR